MTQSDVTGQLADDAVADDLDEFDDGAARRPLTATALVGSLVTVVMMVAALYGWRHAADLAGDWGASRPYVAALGVRSGAVALAAAAQVVLLTLVVGRLFARRQLVDEVLRLAAGLVAALAVVSAIALGLAGR